MSPRVIHTGQAIVDLSLRVPALPSPGGDVFASSHQTSPGGGFNVMAAAARDGASVLYVGGHGTGHFGDLVRTAMAEEGIQLATRADPSSDTGFSVAVVDDAAERSFISTLGAEGNMTAAAYRQAAPAASDVVYVSGYSLFHDDNREALVEWLPSLRADTTVVLDPSPIVADLDPRTLHHLAPSIGIWSMNEHEARILAEHFDVGSTAPLTAVTAGLQEHLGATVICRLGSRGALLASTRGNVEAVPAMAVTAIDTNGAGDAHCGVLCAGLVANRGLVESVRRANVAAAIAVTRSGPATSPSRAEIDAAMLRR